MPQNQLDENKRFRETARVTLVGLAANVVHSILKIAVGGIAGYQALIASGVHSLSDVISDLLAIVALRFGSRGADTRFNYGYRRVETFASLVVALMLVYAAIEIVLHAFHHEGGHAETMAYWPMVLAVILFVIITREYLFHFTKNNGIRLNSPLLIAKAWHHRTDALSSTAVLVGLIVGFLFPHLEAVDAITTVFVSGFILHAAWEIGSKAVKELIDYAPSLKVVSLVEEMAERIPEVTFTHGIRIRTMGGALIVELTAEVSPSITIAESSIIAGKIEQEIVSNVENVMDVIVQITPKGEYVRKLYPDMLDST